MNRRLFLTSLVLGPAALQIALKAKERARARLLRGNRAGMSYESAKLAVANGPTFYTWHVDGVPSNDGHYCSTDGINWTRIQ